MSRILVPTLVRTAVVALALLLPGASAGASAGAVDLLRPAAPLRAGGPARPARELASPTVAAPSGTRSAAAPVVARLLAVRVSPRHAHNTLARRPFRADSLVVEKRMRRLTAWAGGLPLRTYDVALGLNPTGAKRRAQDFRTPEGLYHISDRNPHSKFHRALRISYPNAEDVARARAAGVSTGGDVMVHGLPNGQGAVGMYHRSFDWTNGCVAVTDEEIDELWDAVPVGTPIRILP